jgi:hypothetical protein
VKYPSSQNCIIVSAHEACHARAILGTPCFIFAAAFSNKPMTIVTHSSVGEAAAPELNQRIATVKAWIEAQPGAEGLPFTPRKNSPPLVIIYKVMRKMFAILSVRGAEDVIEAEGRTRTVGAEKNLTLR